MSDTVGSLNRGGGRCYDATTGYGYRWDDGVLVVPLTALDP